MDRLNSNGEMLSQVNLSGVSHSSFDRRNHNFLTGKLGKIIPTRLDEVYPGDRIKGNIQTVVNFEPLAAPIMGSMVLKQESFYVPTSLVWRDAHKFFTGKPKSGVGVIQLVPKVSPREVFNAYVEFGLCPDPSNNTFQSVWSMLNLVDASNALLACSTLFGAIYKNIFTYATDRGMVDLFSPLTDYLAYWCGYTNITDVGVKPDSPLYKLCIAYGEAIVPPDSHWSKTPAGIALINQICDIVKTIYEFYFGPSSLIDYIGFPCLDKWDNYISGVDPNNPQKYSFIEQITHNPDDYIVDDSHDTPVYNYLLPKELFSNAGLNWLPFRANYLVWYWNYRDELLETNCLDPESDSFLSSNISLDERVQLTMLRVRCWYKDTFTTALTNTGDGNLMVPISNMYNFDDNTVTGIQYYIDSDPLSNTHDYLSALAAGANVYEINCGGVSYRIPMNYFAYGTHNWGTNTDESEGTNALSLNLFDRIKRLQNFVQKKLILGYEYDDVVWSSFMVKLSNVRMRIPEILSRGRASVDINTLVNNTQTEQQIAGDKTAVAWSQGSTSDINYFSEEHGYFLSYMTILPIQSYAGGMQRLWCKSEQFDFMWPEFATMGMDAIYNYELSAPRGPLADVGLDDTTAFSVFGYQGRYYDLKSRLDEEHGRLRTDLNYLTFGREFNMKNLPKLNYMFVHCWPALDMFVTDDPKEDVFRADVFHAIDFERRLPVPSEYV